MFHRYESMLSAKLLTVTKKEKDLKQLAKQRAKIKEIECLQKSTKSTIFAPKKQRKLN